MSDTQPKIEDPAPVENPEENESLQDSDKQFKRMKTEESKKELVKEKSNA